MRRRVLILRYSEGSGTELQGPVALMFAARSFAALRMTALKAV
jgi:hypothetical protein